MHNLSDPEHPKRTFPLCLKSFHKSLMGEKFQYETFFGKIFKHCDLIKTGRLTCLMCDYLWMGT